MFDKDIVFLVHGWNGRGGNTMNIRLTKGKQKYNFNKDMNTYLLKIMQTTNFQE